MLRIWRCMVSHGFRQFSVTGDGGNQSNTEIKQLKQKDFPYYVEQFSDSC